MVAIAMDQSKTEHAVKRTAIETECADRLRDIEQVRERAVEKAKTTAEDYSAIVQKALEPFSIDRDHLQFSLSEGDPTSAAVLRLRLDQALKATASLKLRRDTYDWTSIEFLAPAIMGGLTVFFLFWCIASAIQVSPVWCLLFIIATVVGVGIYSTQLDQQFTAAIANLSAIAAELSHRAQGDELVAIRTAEAEFTSGRKNAVRERDQAVNALCHDFEVESGRLSERMDSLYSSVDREIESLTSGIEFAEWTGADWKNWSPPHQFASCLRLGTLVPDMPRFSHHRPRAPRLAIPYLVQFQSGQGLVIRTGKAHAATRQMAQAAITRLLATLPPGGVRFTLIDPVSLGGNVAAFMTLEKYEPTLIGGKAWSDPRHIEQALVEITDHMETVIQKYLREDYKTIADYNAEARVKEAYRVVVIFDFPVHFTDTAAKRLVSIMRNGPRCGVFPIVLVDSEKPMPHGFQLADLEQFATVIKPL